MFTSCYDSKEIDDLLHIVAIGVDKGITDKWRLTVMFPTLKGDSSGGTGGGMQKGSGGQDGYSSITVDAPSFFTGIDMLNSTLARRLNFMHTELMVISEDLAESGMLGEFIAPIIRFRQIRRSMHVFISVGSAMDYVDATKPFVGTALSKNIQIMAEEAGITGFFAHITLQNFYDSMKSTYRQPVVVLGALNNPENLKQDGENSENVYKTGGEYYAGELPFNAQGGTEIFGMAVFDGDKMVGKLTGDETRFMQMANGEFKMAFFTMQDPKDPSLIIPLDVRKLRNPSVKIKFEGDKPIIHLKIELEGDLLAVQSGINYEQPELKPILEKAFERQIKDGLDKLMEKSKKFKTDIFGFGQTAAMHFLTIQEWEKYNWSKKFQNSEITTEVKFIIRRTGTQLESSPIISSEGKK
jgi:Ger(x)C family germination protein